MVSLTLQPLFTDLLHQECNFSPSTLHSLWSASTHCRGTLPQAWRLENLSLRLWGLKRNRKAGDREDAILVPVRPATVRLLGEIQSPEARARSGGRPPSGTQRMLSVGHYKLPHHPLAAASNSSLSVAASSVAFDSSRSHSSNSSRKASRKKSVSEFFNKAAAARKPPPCFAADEEEEPAQEEARDVSPARAEDEDTAMFKRTPVFVAEERSLLTLLLQQRQAVRLLPRAPYNGLDGDIPTNSILDVPDRPGAPAPPFTNSSHDRHKPASSSLTRQPTSKLHLNVPVLADDLLLPYQTSMRDIW